MHVPNHTRGKKVTSVMFSLSTRRKQRLVFALIFISGASVAVALFLYSFEKNLLYFYSPTQFMETKVPVGQRVNLGGLVEEGSVKHSDVSRFTLTDRVNTIHVVYSGLLPDLFVAGRGAVVTGVLRVDGVFDADTVLAKHDENYMPPYVAEVLDP